MLSTDPILLTTSWLALKKGQEHRPSQKKQGQTISRPKCMWEKKWYDGIYRRGAFLASNSISAGVCARARPQQVFFAGGRRRYIYSEGRGRSLETKIKEDEVDGGRWPTLVVNEAVEVGYEKGLEACQRWWTGMYICSAYSCRVSR